ncbi:MAG: DUF1844 domain-containing protein [Candidatus Brocadiia bacterium]
MPEEQDKQQPEIKTDEEWKKAVQEERERLREQEGGEAGEGEQPTREAFPEPSIPVFMAGLYTQCLVALGDLQNPATGEREPNRAEAEYLIDVIALLRGKMEGNLEPEEESYVQNILTDLRMRYVSGAGGGQSEEEE